MSCEANAKACFLFNNPFALYLVACWSGRIKYLSLDIIVFFQSCTNLSLYYVHVQLHLVCYLFLPKLVVILFSNFQYLCCRWPPLYWNSWLSLYWTKPNVWLLTHLLLMAYFFSEKSVNWLLLMGQGFCLSQMLLIYMPSNTREYGFL